MTADDFHIMLANSSAVMDRRYNYKPVRHHSENLSKWIHAPVAVN